MFEHERVRQTKDGIEQIRIEREERRAVIRRTIAVGWVQREHLPDRQACIADEVDELTCAGAERAGFTRTGQRRDVTQHAAASSKAQLGHVASDDAEK